MLLVPFFWIMLTAVIAYGAGQKGRSKFEWGVLALVCSPLIAGIALLFARDLTPKPEGTNR